MTSEYSTLHFDDQGNPLFVEEQEAVIRSLLNVSTPVTDLWIFSHGWRTSEKQADVFYRKWVHCMQEQVRRDTVDSTYRPLFVGIYWPSIACISGIKSVSAYPPLSPLEGITFPVDSGEFEINIEESLLGSALEEAEHGSENTQFVTGKSDIDQLSFTLELENKEHFIEVYRNMVGLGGPKTMDYEQDFALLYDILTASSPPPIQLETFLEILYRYKIDDPHLEDIENDNIIKSPAKTLTGLRANLNIATTAESLRPASSLFECFQAFTFWTMKARAAVVGQNGVVTFLRDVKETLSRHHRDVHIHLLGHSFGAKLLSAAICGLADISHLQAPLVDSLTLLLGAFSQFSFSSQIPLESGIRKRAMRKLASILSTSPLMRMIIPRRATTKSGSAGRYSSIIERHLIAHPVTAIYSCHDLANKRCYPLGMSMDRSHSTYERGGPDDRLGSIGANGAQGLGTTPCRTMGLLPLEVPYDGNHFSNIAFLNIDAQHIINTYADKFFVGAHGDIYHPEIFHLALAISRYQ